MATGLRPFATFSPQVSGAVDRGSPAIAVGRRPQDPAFWAGLRLYSPNVDRDLNVTCGWGYSPIFTCACTQGNLIKWGSCLSTVDSTGSGC
jgi:hypothetical protein